MAEERDCGLRNLLACARLGIFRPGSPITDRETRAAIGRTKDKRLGMCHINSAWRKIGRPKNRRELFGFEKLAAGLGLEPRTF